MPSPRSRTEVVVDRPRKLTGAVFVLAHGAGGSKDDPLLVDLKDALVARGHAIVRFEFAYRAAGKKLPDKAPVLEATWRDALAAARRSLARSKPRAWIIGGKSMGGRIASHLAAQGETVDGLLLLGYPLHPALKRPGDAPKKLRVDHLADIAVPSLFLSGTRDPLCDLDRLRAALASVRSHTLHVLADADHSLSRPKRVAGSRADQIAEIAGVIDAWVESLPSSVTVPRGRSTLRPPLPTRMDSAESVVALDGDGLDRPPA